MKERIPFFKAREKKEQKRGKLLDHDRGPEFVLAGEISKQSCLQQFRHVWK